MTDFGSVSVSNCGINNPNKHISFWKLCLLALLGALMSSIPYQIGYHNGVHDQAACQSLSADEHKR